uniref:Uncharacterized protein n=1 Tax=Glycine max TaxID=3847 RepID=K7KYJ1_SOYBN
MAETAVSFSLEEVFQILKKETNLLRGIHKDFSDIRDELESIQTFLKDADRRAAADEANTNDGIRTWVKQVREASFRIEDVVYEYLRVIHVIATEIRDIKLSLSLIKERSERHSRWHDPRMSSLFIKETEILVLELPIDELVGWLLKGTEEHTVISVVGMGGLGKTTLAKHVFYSEIVKSHFHCRACIKVSQSYTMRGLLIDMIKQFCRETNDRLPQMLQEMDEKSLISKVRQYLKQKRYLIFFDDVWHEDFCDQVEFAMPNNNKSSRIIVTTRVRHVAEFFKKSFLVHVHNLQPLLPDKAWELFCKKAFRFEPDGHFPGELEGISNEIFRKCKGLPMEIVAIGDLLPTKSKTAKGNYDDPPSYLKPCILYFGVYPEDYSIHHNRLTRQWIAERFVQYDGRTSENVADEYLSEEVRSCQVHDLLHEVIIAKAKDLNLCHFVHGRDESGTSRITRRLSIDTSSNNVPKSSNNTHIRAIHAFGKGGLLEPFMMGQLSSKSRLKVLELEGTSLNYAPSNLGNLFHLRYLNLRSTKIRVLPTSVDKLQNLETLDIRDTFVHELLSEINKLKKLRHLFAFYRNYQAGFSVLGFTTGVLMKKGIKNLTSLENLTHVEMSMLKQLRKLGLRCVRREHGNAICASVVEMTHLESLNITAIARLEKMPSWISKLDYLIYMRLGVSNLKDDPLRWLENLPNLLKLSLWDNAYHLKKVSSGIKALENLKVLDFISMPTEFVESIVPENGPDYQIINHVPLVFVRHWIGPKVSDYKVRSIHSSSKDS